MDKLLELIKDNDDIVNKKINIDNKDIYFIYSEILCNNTFINKLIIDIYNKVFDINYFNTLNETLNLDDVIDKINSGYLIIIYNDKVLNIELKSNLNRSISNADSEIAIRGSKDSFTENKNTNIGLIKKRLNSKHLKHKNLLIGRESKTKTSILYMDNIVNKKLVKDILNKLNNINIDGILDSSYVKKMINDNDIFPSIMTTERPDLSTMALLEGKVIIIVDNSPYALIIPSFFIDFFHTPDDYYQNNLSISLIRIIRLIAFLIAIFLPGIYIALTTYNIEFLDSDLLISFIKQRSSVPIPTFIEALLMMIAFEILRESDMRSSSTIGSSVSILGGLILGDALVSAGIISPIMIIIIAISAISGLVFTSVELSSAIRFFRVLILFLSSMLGIYGIYLGFIYLLISLAKIEIFNYPYMTPLSPFNKQELKDSFIKIKNKKYLKRNPILTKNIVRGKL